MPTISVCIPCYRSERFVRTTVESVLAQTVQPNEIILSDDHSPDGSFAILQEYEGLPRVRVMRPPERTTLGGHYRFLLEQATGDYICFLSSDDALHPKFIETMTKQLEGETDIALISGACFESDSRLRPISYRGPGGAGRALDPPESFHYFLRGCIYTISFSLFSRRVLTGTPRIPQAGDLATDWCWAIQASAKGRVKFQPKAMGYYRVHTTNSGHNNGEAWEKACLVMLSFLRETLPPELGIYLQPKVDDIRKQIEQTHGTVRAPKQGPTPKQIISNAIKRVMALPHRRLSHAILQAEAGNSVALAAKS